MNIYYLACLPAWIGIMTIAFARLVHMTRAQWTFGHHMRRLGFIMMIGYVVSILMAPFVQDGWQYSSVTARSVLGAWGLLLVWVNSPGMPPLADYILGVHREVEGYCNLTIAQRVKAEARAIARSFRGTPR